MCTSYIIDSLLCYACSCKGREYMIIIRAGIPMLYSFQ